MTWKTVRLRDVARVDARTVQPAAIAANTTYIGLEHIGRRGALDVSTSAGEVELKSAKNRFDRQHVLFGKLRPNLGKVARLDVSGICSTDIYPLLPSDAIDRAFLSHWLLTPEAIAYSISRTTGVNLPRVSWAALGDLPVPLPPLPEQRRIAAILDEADALRRARLRSMGSMTELPARIFAAFDTHDWHEATVGEIAELQGGLTINRRREALPLKASYLRVANVLRGAIDTTELKSLGVTETELARTRIQIGDVLMVEGHGNASEVGRAAFVENLPTPSLTHQNHLFRLRPQGDRVLGRFLELALNSSHAREYLRRASNTTSGLNTLSATNVRALPLRIAPLEIQHEIVAMVDQVRASEHRAVRTTAELDALFASLRHRAFRGEL